ncbi:MAG: TRAP transporter large permease subunit [Saprospiraceae bacterium]|nr:TRAP transporter large permease subunit [Saprospiraceae bacterium]
MEWLALVLFGLIFILILSGYPVALTLGGLSILFGSIFLGPEFFDLLPLRFKGIMENVVLIAVPLFIYMGIMLEKSGLAESMLSTMARLFGRFRGGLAISVVIVGALLAASTGIVGATVVTMGLISLPIMLKNGYSNSLATGTIAASGTLGQIIPPSIVLVLLADTLSNYSGNQVVDVGALFSAALGPGIILVLLYILYIIGIAIIKPEAVPIHANQQGKEGVNANLGWQTLKAFVLPFLLILAVLGSIFKGIASPTEAAAIGAFGATILTLTQGKFSLRILKEVMKETTLLTSMVFLILLGATTFSLVFRGMGGDRFLTEVIVHSNLSPYLFLALVMVVIFIAGFFIDFIEIIFIIVPVVAPIFANMGIDLVWVGILIALNLQTSFLTPPFGFSLFYLKGVAPPGVTTRDIYKGIVPFVIIQVIFIGLVIVFPEILKIFSY